MSVKNIARNLFVSGVLVLSVGAVCGRPVSANNAIDDMVSAAFDCLIEAEKCINGVLKESAMNGDFFCVDGREILGCFVQQQKCLGKLNEDYPMNIDDVDVHTLD